MFQYINLRRIGRMYSSFCFFIGAIRAGKEPIIFGPGYVAMSQRHYEKIKSNQGHFRMLGVGGLKETPPEFKKAIDKHFWELT